MKSSDLEVLYEDNHVIVVHKPANILSQGDITGDKDLLTVIKEYVKEKYHKPGNVYIGLVHRLDRPVGGVMVFAKTSKCASRLSEQIRNGGFKKVYYAVVEGNIFENGLLKDKLLKDECINTVKVDNNGKDAELYFERIDYKDSLSLVKINLKTGRSHQIRVQFSSRGYPLYGDHRYNKNCKKNSQIALFAQSLSFNHPITKEKVTYSLPLPSRYPFNIFK
jgi:23S rRNA pseudouridine1911/1915/1917 synthase